MTEPVNPDRPPDGGTDGWVLFSPQAAGAFAAIAGAAAWFGSGILVLLASVLFALVLVVRGWSLAALARLTFERQIEQTRAFPGDVITCHCRLENRKPLPLVRVDVVDRLPAGVAPDFDAESGFTRDGDNVTYSTALLWYQKASWTHQLRCRRRGYYPIGPALLKSGDLFGLLMRSKPAADGDALIIYPRIHALRDLGLPSLSPLGDNRSRDPLHQDPMRFRGLREHTPEIPFRHIHWKATARTGELQAKVFDPSCSLRVAILLDASAFTDAATRDEDGPFEQTISAAASLAWHLAKARNAVGLFADARQADGGPFIAVPANSGLEHLAAILTALAKVTEPATSPDLLDVVEPRLVAGTTLAVVSGGLRPNFEARLSRLRRRGFPVSIYLTGTAPMPATTLPCRRLHPLRAEAAE